MDVETAQKYTRILEMMLANLGELENASRVCEESFKALRVSLEASRRQAQNFAEALREELWREN